MDYKTSGVDIIKGRSFVEYIKALSPNIGGFSGMMEISPGYEKPVLVSGVDGVGTKINICRIADDYTTICLLYTSPSPRDATLSRMPSSA